VADFLDAVDPTQGLTVLGQWIPRARLGQHLRLDRLSARIAEALDADNAAEAARLMSAYFVEVGLDVEGADGVERLRAYLQLVELNQLKWLLPFQEWDAPPLAAPAYDYPHRAWAWWVHKLASRYGWSEDKIFSLWPEAAAAYLQEILVSEFEEADEARALSDLAYSYDKHSKTATFRPLPRPAWMVREEPVKTVRIRRSMLPVGNVIDLSKLGPDDVILH
jgi:hypothetical protein